MSKIDEKEFATSVAVTLAEDTIRGVWKSVSSFFKDLSAKDQIRYGTAYESYINSIQARYSKIKTIIFRRISKDIYSFYEPMYLLHHRKTLKTTQIENVLACGKKLLLIGTGGLGKSMMIRHLLLSTIKSTCFIPVLIELRTFNNSEAKDISLYRSIFKALTDNGFTLDEKYFDYSLKEGAYIIFLDGYDEVSRDRVGKLTDEIKALSSKYNQNHFIISSRPTDEFIGWNDYDELRLVPLSKEQALSLINKLDFDENVKQAFSKELDSHLYEKYQSFASNPLLLNIMLLTFQKHASIPERLNEFYDEAFVTLFNVHDATKDSYVRDIRCGLGCEDFKLIFAYVCFKSYFRDQYEFSLTELREYIKQAKSKFPTITFREKDFLDDLLMSVCMIIKDGLSYHFSHRSFQEYFAAWYTCKLLDEQQSKLLHSWIKESPRVLTDSYLQILFDLQRDKVNRIILVPILKQIHQIYSENGFSLTLLEKLFDSITFKYSIEPKKRKVNASNITLQIKDTFLCHGLLLNKKLNFPHTVKAHRPNEAAQKLINLLIDTTKERQDISNREIIRRVAVSFEGVTQVASEDVLLSCIPWLKEDLDLVEATLAQYETTGNSRKRKVASILEDL